MNKKMRELLSKMQAKTDEAKSLMSDETNKDVEKAAELMNEVADLQKEFNVEKRIFELDKDNSAPSEEELEKQKKVKETEDSVGKFAKAVKDILLKKSLVEGIDTDGGYTVPEDIQTKINKYAEVSYSLLGDIAVENVTTNKGSRTYQVKATGDVFVDVDENGAITKEIAAPKFERVSYLIKDRAGFMPVSNDLISDSDANITNTVTEWLGKAKVATSNAKILAIIAAKAKTDLKDLDGIRKAVTVTLGSAYKATSKIITNDDGLNYLDTLKDGDNRPLLNPDPTSPTDFRLRCGNVTISVKAIPNDVMASAPNAEQFDIPFIIGDLKQAIKKFDRQSMSIKASDVATIGSFNAYAQNMTLFRAILRDDYKEIDKDAYVNGYITV